ncbi:hypothetical protein BDZ89DRAFT_994888 [Hymenopellis radicata]|nr:hypothetical protein BDZ89DRAFT_994888 [Hymenopellis radicata]
MVVESSGSTQIAGVNIESDAPLDVVYTVIESSGPIRNALDLLTEAPLDVVFEIFSYFEPLDLLQISRTTKTLRSFLMSKSCIAVWQGALRRVEGLPPVIEGFNEPQYASLLFDSLCYNCWKKHHSYIMWEIRMRLCQECLDEGTIMATEEQLRRRHSFGDHDKARELLKITPHVKHGRVYISVYHRSTWERVVDESSTLRRGSPEYAAWLEKKQKEYSALAESCKKYEQYINLRKVARAAELRALLQHRLTSVIGRLQADGWEEELKDRSVLKTLLSHPYVNVAEQLSDHSWGAIRPTLTELMSNLRIDLRRRNMQVRIKERTRLVEDLGYAYFAKLPETPHNPPPSALSTYQPFRDIIMNTPHNEDATPKLKEAFESVPAICEKWRTKQEADLKAILRKTGRSDDLSLVVNAFTCSAGWRCQYFPTVLHYPHFATHMCFITSAAVGDTDVAVWSGRGIETLSDGMYNVCVGIVRASGLDPATATAEDMDAADVFFRCEDAECSEHRPVPGFQTFTLMRWRTAMNHPHLRRVIRVEDDELIALGRVQERLSLENDLAASCAPRLRYRLTFVCIHCNMTETSRTARAQHLRSVHGIQGELKTSDHYRRSSQFQHTNEEWIVVKKATPAGAIVLGH